MRFPSRLPVLGLLACMAGASACGRGSSPNVDGVAPQAICTEQGTVSITVSGHGLSPMVSRGLTNRPEGVAPGVSLVLSKEIAVEPGQPTARSVALSSSSVHWVDQSSLGFEFAPGTASPGIYDIEIRNPNGEVTRLADGLVIVPPPAARALEPEVIAGEEPNTVTVHGDYFLARSDARPTVLVHGAGPEPLMVDAGGVADCTALPGPGSPQLCRAVTLTLPPGTLGPGVFTIEVVNPAPADCTTRGVAAGTEARLPLTVVPRPKIATVGPGVSCIAETDGAVTVTGEGFLVHGDGSPTLVLGTLALPTTAAGCTDVALEAGFAPRARALSSCTDLTATVPKGSMPPGVVAAVVRNPPTSPGASEPVQYLVAGPPVVSGVASDVVCAGKGGDAVKLLGQGFLKVAGQTPVVRLGATEVPAEAAGCTPVTGLAQPVEVCTELSAKLPKDSIPGPYAVVVRNPAFAPCSSVMPITVVNVAPPTIAKVAPPRFCGAVDSKLSLTGTDFLVLGGVVPTVEIGGAGVTAVPKLCLPIAGSTTGALRCTGLDLTVPAGAVDAASQEIKVENPVPADCGATAPVPVEVGQPPVISSARVSASVGGAAVIEISGSGFVPGAKVSVGGLATSGGTVVSATSAIAVVAPGASASGGATVTIDNGDGCASTASISVGGIPPLVGASVGVLGSPLLSTRAALGSVTTPLTITGVNGAASVVLQGSAGSLALPFAADPLRPGHLLAALPKGTAAGRYDVVVTGRDGRTELAGRLEVVAAAASVAEAGTVVAEQGEGARLEVADGGGVGLPAAFLVRSVAGEAAVAVPLAGVARRANGTLDAGTAGASLEPGDYDLLLVGPARDGAPAEARLAPRALHIAPSGPGKPEIDAVKPGLLAAEPEAEVRVNGRQLLDPALVLECRTPSGQVQTHAPTSVVSGSGEAIAATFDALELSGSACALRLTNADGTTAQAGPIAVAAPAGGTVLRGSSALASARRAPAATSARAASGERLLFALGGEGAGGGPLASVEIAELDRFGVPRGWAPGTSLRAPRAGAAAVTAGQCLYLIGGTDGANALASVERACLLDSGLRPELGAVSLVSAETGGLAAGSWHYRVSAMLASGGETVASDSAGVDVPGDAGKPVAIELEWARVEGAVGYRVYRTAVSGEPAGAERLIAETSAGATSFVDGGEPVESATPLAPGATGPWEELAPLGAARVGASAAVETTGEGQLRILVSGGRDANGIELGSTETLAVAVDAAGNQVAAGRWEQDGAVSLAPERKGLFRAGLPLDPGGAAPRSAGGDGEQDASSACPARAACVREGGLLYTIGGTAPDGGATREAGVTVR